MQITHVSRQTTRDVRDSTTRLIEQFVHAYNSEESPSYRALEQDDMLVELFRETIVHYNIVQAVGDEYDAYLDDMSLMPIEWNYIQAATRSIARTEIDGEQHNLLKDQYQHFRQVRGLQRYSMSAYRLRPINGLTQKHLKSTSYTMYLAMDHGTRKALSDEFRYLVNSMNNTVHQEFMKSIEFSATQDFLSGMQDTLMDYFTVHVMAAYYDTFQKIDYKPEQPMKWQTPFSNARFLEVYNARRPELYQLLYSVMKVTPLNTRRDKGIRRAIRKVLTNMVEYDPGMQKLPDHATA